MFFQWVQCDKCEGWQHKICGLYNDKSDLEKKAEYICPICSLIEKKSGYCRHSSNGVLSRAEGLPQTKLSNHIEQRLLRRLEEERVERAKTTENSFNEVRITLYDDITLLLPCYFASFSINLQRLLVYKMKK